MKTLHTWLFPIHSRDVGPSLPFGTSIFADILRLDFDTTCTKELIIGVYGQSNLCWKKKNQTNTIFKLFVKIHYYEDSIFSSQIIQ